MVCFHTIKKKDAKFKQFQFFLFSEKWEGGCAHAYASIRYNCCVFVFVRGGVGVSVGRRGSESRNFRKGAKTTVTGGRGGRQKKRHILCIAPKAIILASAILPYIQNYGFDNH